MNKLEQIKNELLDAEFKYYDEKCTACKSSDVKLYKIDIGGVLVYVCGKCKEAVCESVYVDKVNLDEMSMEDVREMFNVYEKE